MSVILFEGATPDFKATIRRPSGEEHPPVLSAQLKRYHRDGYVHKRQLTASKRYQLDIGELITRADKFVNVYNKVRTVMSPLLTDYDKEEVLSATCGLGYVNPVHFDVDNDGDVGLDGQTAFPPEMTQPLVDYYKRRPAATDVSLSLPRGKNIGFPTPIGGMNRELTDILLALFAGMTVARSKLGFKQLSDMTSFLSSLHSDPFLVMGERRQHTAKVRFGFPHGDTIVTQNVQPRVRSIYMSPKYMVAWSRKPVKDMLYRILNTPWHSQDRSKISSNIKAWEKKGWKGIAVDFSGFDKTAGGNKGRSVLKMIAEITDCSFDDLDHEFSTPLLTVFRGETYLRGNSPILPSGISSTTLVGCLCADTIVLNALASVFKKSTKAIIDAWGQDYGYLDWGDDVVIYLPADKVGKFDELKKYFAEYGFKIDQEVSIKYLGANYSKGSFDKSIDMGYSMGRAVQVQFFPERTKTWPFNVIGHIARLELMGAKAKAYHDLIRSVWPEDYRNYFLFDQRHDVLRELIVVAQKKSEDIGNIDDVLNVFTHGIDDEDLADLIGLPGDFQELQALSKAKLDDPVKFLTDVAKTPTVYSDYLKQLMKGDLSFYHKLLQQITIDYNLQWRKGDLLY